MIGILLALTVLGPQDLLGERTEPLPIDVVHRGDDAGGEQLAYLLRDQFRGSSTFRVTSQDAFYKVMIDSTDMRSVTQRPSTSYAVVILADQSSQDGYPEGYITSKVGYCEIRMIADCAAQLYAETGAEIEQAHQEMTDSVNDAVAEILRGVSSQ